MVPKGYIRFLILAAFPALCWAALTAQEVDDGMCLPITELGPHLHRRGNAVPLLTSGHYYVPMGSQAMYRHYAEALLGRLPTDQEEVDAMQLRIYSGPLFVYVNTTGYPKTKWPPRFSQTCLSIAVPNILDGGLPEGRIHLDYAQAICFGLTGRRPGGTITLKPSHPFMVTVNSVIWASEDSSVGLVYRCPSDNIKDFQVISQKKTLSDEDIATVKMRVKMLGFEEKNIAYMKYDE